MWRAAAMKLMKTAFSVSAPAASAASRRRTAMLPRAPLPAAHSLADRSARVSAANGFSLAQRSMWAQPSRAYFGTAPPSTMLAQEMGVPQAYSAQGGPEEPAVIHEVEWSVNNSNYISIIGTLGADPDVKQLASGAVVANLRIAHHTPQKLTEWYTVDAWGSWAEGVRNAGLAKGRQILVEGRLKTDEWTDKASGTPRRAVRIVASQISTVRPFDASAYQSPVQQPDGGGGEWGQAGAQPPPPGGEWSAEDQTAGAYGALPPKAQQVRGGVGPKDAAWEAYFANPGSYWDNRTKKLNPKAPDFKNKETNEALWLNGAPGWVATELDRLEGRAPQQGDDETPPF